MSLIVKIVIAVIVFLIIIYIYNHLSDPSKTLSSLQDATIKSFISSSDLPDDNNTSQNYTYSTWIYINDWNYKYGEEKIILGRIDATGKPGPVIKLGAYSNNAIVSINCYTDPNVDTTNNDNTQNINTENGIVHQCSIENIPMQSWVNLLISLNGRTLDVYLDGKLVRTCVLPGVAKIAQNAPVIITPQGGFSGWTSNIKYWSTPTNPQQAWNIYKRGFGGSMFGNLFNQFRIKITFLNNNQEEGSFEL